MQNLIHESRNERTSGTSLALFNDDNIGCVIKIVQVRLYEEEELVSIHRLLEEWICHRVYMKILMAPLNNQPTMIKNNTQEVTIGKRGGRSGTLNRKNMLDKYVKFSGIRVTR